MTDVQQLPGAGAGSGSWSRGEQQGTTTTTEPTSAPSDQTAPPADAPPVDITGTDRDFLAEYLEIVEQEGFRELTAEELAEYGRQQAAERAEYEEERLDEYNRQQGAELAIESGLSPSEQLVAEADAATPYWPSLAGFGESSLRGMTPEKPEWQQRLEDARRATAPLGSKLTPEQAYARALGKEPRNYYAEELGRFEARLQVREHLAAEASAAMPDYEHGLLSEMLALPPEPPYRIEGLMVSDGTATIVSQRKAGKTTLTGNLGHSLITGSAFLGSFDVLPIEEDHRVGMLNFEVSAQQHARWMADMAIPVDRLWTAHLRGRRNPFTDKAGRSLLARRLKQARVETLIVDPFANAFTGDNPNEDASVTPFLNMLQEFVRTDAGVRDLIVVVHSGWTEGRSRGSSRLEDWPDAIWYLRKDKDTGARYFRADGRDVALDEHELEYDPSTRLLTLGGTTSSSDADNVRVIAAMTISEQVIDFVKKYPGKSTNAITTALTESLSCRKATVRDALVMAAEATPALLVCRRKGTYATAPTHWWPAHHADIPPLDWGQK